MNVVSYGGGTNSTALLIGMLEHGERPDHILFADTGGEKPHTYENVRRVSGWAQSNGFPPIVTVAEHKTLEQDCLDRGALPSIAYGFKTCSQRWKARPQERYLKALGAENVTRLIGFDAGEAHRARPFPGNRYPLIEWNWGREECVEAIARAGLPQPGKSSCFFCPSSKKSEILKLAEQYPELMQRALAMEANAELTTVQGLGRSFSWAQLIDFAERQLTVPFSVAPEIPCECET